MPSGLKLTSIFGGDPEEKISYPQTGVACTRGLTRREDHERALEDRGSGGFVADFVNPESLPEDVRITVEGRDYAQAYQHFIEQIGYLGNVIDNLDKAGREQVSYNIALCNNAREGLGAAAGQYPVNQAIRDIMAAEAEELRQHETPLPQRPRPE